MLVCYETEWWGTFERITIWKLTNIHSHCRLSIRNLLDYLRQIQYQHWKVPCNFIHCYWCVVLFSSMSFRFLPISLWCSHAHWLLANKNTKKTDYPTVLPSKIYPEIILINLSKGIRSHHKNNILYLIGKHQK